MNQDNNIILILKTLLEHLEKKKTFYFRLCVFVSCFRDQNFSLGKRKIQLRKEGKKEGRLGREGEENTGRKEGREGG